MDDTDTDYTGRMGNLYQDREPPEWPMYSYSRPAYLFWSGFANALRERGLTDEQIREELQSKGTRWLLDARSDEVEELGRKMGTEYSLCVTSLQTQQEKDQAGQ